MCVCHLRLGVRKNGSGISFLSNCLEVPTLWAFVATQLFAPLSVTVLSLLTLPTPPSPGREPPSQVTLEQTLNGELSLQTLPP